MIKLNLRRVGMIIFLFFFMVPITLYAQSQPRIQRIAVMRLMNKAGLSIDETGLNQFDFKLLKVLSESRELRPIGVKTLSSLLGEEVDYIESICEPFLLKNGLIQKTSSGRIITTKGLKFLSDNKI